MVASIFLGIVVNGCNPNNPGNVPESLQTDELETLWEIWDILQQEFVGKESLNNKNLNSGALSVMNSFAEQTGILIDSGRVPPIYRPPSSVPAELKPIWEKWIAILETALVNGKTVQSEILVDQIIAGFLHELDDPYTQYIPPNQFNITRSNLEGEYQGIGAEIYFHGDNFIINPMPNSPAERAGIMPGDVLLSVNGENVQMWSLIQLVSRVRGTKGTKVLLGILRSGSNQPLEIEVERGRITLESVYWKFTANKIAYVRLGGFYANSDEFFSKVLKDILDADAAGLVLDLRNNPGGYLETVSKITSEFISEGLVAYEKGPDGKKTEWRIKGRGQALDIPLVILVNEFSASASEVLTGALQDSGRAVVVGSRTYGKGSVNRLKKLSNGGGLYYTYARWYTPKGRLIEGKGLEPDVFVKNTDTIIGSEEDIPLNRAIEILQSQIDRSRKSN